MSSNNMNGALTEDMSEPTADEMTHVHAGDGQVTQQPFLIVKWTDSASPKLY